MYGDAPALRDLIARAGRFYVLAVSANTPVWTDPPVMEEPAGETGGRPRTKPRLAPEAAPASEVRQVIATLPAEAWVRLTVNQGEKGPITYEWAWVRVLESRDGLPGPAAWLLARRSVTGPTKSSYYLSNAPEDTPRPKLAEVASVRYTIEQCLEEGKGETGLDEYEVRHWGSWHRHITLSMMAHTWLASLRQGEQEQETAPDPEESPLTVPEVRRLLEGALPLPPQSVAFRLAWSSWRQRRRQQARRSYYRRRLGGEPADSSLLAHGSLGRTDR